MDFPKESIELARDIVSKYRRWGISKKNLAAHIYDGNFYHITYGFSESLKTGNCGRHFHEIKKEAECYTMAGVLYLLAREAGLNPKIYSARGMKDVEEGMNPEESGRADHSFIVVEMGTKKGKPIYQTIDPFMQRYGVTKLDLDKNQMEILQFDSGSGRKLFYRDWNFIEEVSKEEYLKKLNENRTPQGGRDTLEATQSVKSLHDQRVHITYLPENHELLTSAIYPSSTADGDKYNKSIIFKLQAPIKRNGEFSLEQGVFSSQMASAPGWGPDEHVNLQVPISFNLQDIKGIEDIFTEFTHALGYKIPPSRQHPYKTAIQLSREGLWIDFSVDKGSLIEKIVTSSKHKQAWRDFQDFTELTINDFLSHATQDELTMKVIFRDAHNYKLSTAARSPENLGGQIFTEEEHEDFLRSLHKQYGDAIFEYSRAWVKHRGIRAKLFSGSEYNSERNLNVLNNKRSRVDGTFANLIEARKIREDGIFQDMADRFMFEDSFDIERPISELKHGLTAEDIQRAAKGKLFNALLNAWNKKEILFVKQYQKGLQKILNLEN